MARKQELYSEYQKSIQPLNALSFVDFLVARIEQLENPLHETQIKIQKGGETNGNSKKVQGKPSDE